VAIDDLCADPGVSTWNPRAQLLGIQSAQERSILSHVHIYSFLPFKRGRRRTFLIDVVYGSTKDGNEQPEDRDFDWESIMAYSSYDNMIDMQHPVMVKCSDCTTWRAPLRLNPGDGMSELEA
jgi:hypothetical protein